MIKATLLVIIWKWNPNW